MVKYLAGTLGLVALCAALVIGWLAATGVFSYAPISFQTGDSRPSRPDLGPLTTQKAQLSKKTFTAGDVRWTITGVRHVNKLKAFAYPPKSERGDFVVVSFEAKNTSKSPVTLSKELMDLTRDGEVIPPAAVTNTEYVPPEKDLLFTEIGLLAPGESKKGTVNFDLDPYSVKSRATLKGVELEIKNNNLSTGKSKSLDLKF